MNNMGDSSQTVRKFAYQNPNMDDKYIPFFSLFLEKHEESLYKGSDILNLTKTGFETSSSQTKTYWTEDEDSDWSHYDLDC